MASLGCIVPYGEHQSPMYRRLLHKWDYHPRRHEICRIIPVFGCARPKTKKLDVVRAFKRGIYGGVRHICVDLGDGERGGG